LAELAHTKQSAIAMYETGKKNPTADTLQRLLRAMGAKLQVSYEGELPSDIVLRNRQKILDIAAKYNIRKVSIFGSVARGDDTPDSDIDLLIEKKTPGAIGIYNLQTELEITLDHPVDVVDLASLNEYHGEIFTDARVLGEIA
jgi:predicted nucleotidyltransferase